MANARTQIILLLCFLVAATQSFAQEPASVSDRVSAGIDKLRADFPGARVQIDAVTELPRSISGLASPSETALILAAEDPADIVRAFFAERGQDLFVMAQPLQETRILSTRPDPNFAGQWVVRVQQQVGDVPVFGAQATVEVQPGVGVLSLKSAMVTPPDVATEPKISEEDALKVALIIYQGILAEMSDEERADIDALEAGIAEVEIPVLTIFDPSVLKLKEQRVRLSWQVRIGDFVIFVDSEEGSLVYSYLDFQSALNRQTNDLKLGNFPGVKVLDESGPIMSGGITPDATSAHEFARLVYKFYKETFERDSYDDDDGVGPNGGGKLLSYVRRDRMRNAAWNRRRKAIVYGPDYAKALDIAAHEFTHAVIQHSANLIYANEPGALNESFADIFGVLIEASYESEDWSLGENLPQYAPPNPPLRSMGDPHSGGFKRDQAFSDVNRGQPDHYSEYVRSTERICKTTTDKFNGCVHFNSGIFNKAAYLIAKGGRHHGETVTGIGRAKLAEIMYRTLLTKLGSSSAMAAAADSVIESCDELAVSGQFGITDFDCNEVNGAFRAVGLK